ncbi:MAG: GyrI-like domain-containing protein [Dermatophilaceae bacterium]|nr:GyrI-like domain-containing protein [Dermatophilaceae bacterium]
MSSAPPSGPTDLRRLIPTYAARRGHFDVVTVPPLQYLMIDGHGDPNTSQAYADALATLYPVAYALKFHSKRVLDHDYRVMPLEALWWSDSMDSFTTQRDKSAWNWTAMTLVPDWISREQVADAYRHLADRQPDTLAPLRLAVLDEGLAVQTLHVGSYDDEGPILHALHDEVIPSHGLRLHGIHHEIYLNDARRTAPARLRTILRQPARPHDAPSDEEADRTRVLWSA